MLNSPTPFANRFPLFTAVLLTLAALTGCSGGPPSEGEAGSKIQELINERSEGAIELTDFRKVDGQGREKSGINIYEMDVEGQVEIQEDCYWSPPSRSNSMSQAFSVAPASEQGDYWDRFRTKLVTPERSSKGERYSFSGSMTFEQKESGWNLSDMDLNMTSSE